MQPIRIVAETTAATHAAATEPLEVLAAFGGFELVQMAGAMLQAAELEMVVLVDGFIATATLLAATKLYPNVLAYCVFCHQSDEAGHARLLAHLGGQPVALIGFEVLVAFLQAYVFAILTSIYLHDAVHLH